MNEPFQPDEWRLRRENMVDLQVRRRGIKDERVLSAMMNIPRERFVPESAQETALEDRALSIGHGQTISQPYIVAYMTEQLAVTSQSRVLEVGTGTGYQTAILATLCAHVYTIERLDALQQIAEQRLAELNLTNVTFFRGDGSVGLDRDAPYDRIMVTAAAPSIPASLVDQLVDGGRLIIPVGPVTEQTIVRLERHGSRTVEKRLLACRFVKLIGREAWEIPP